MNTALTQVESIDPIAASLNSLLVIVFPRSTSKNFPLALKLAQRVSCFKEGDIEGKTFYFVCISSEKNDVLTAKALLDYVSGWKGTRVFISGSEYESAYTAMQVLNCYSRAMQCSDTKAHCQVITDHPVVRVMKSMAAMGGMFGAFDKLRKQPRLLFPCRFIAFYNNVIQEEHPSSIQDQIQAAAVRYGCHWCPLFDQSKVGIINP